MSLSPGQTIATCQHNISQHCWAQHVACVWPPCLDMLDVVGSNLTSFKLEPTTPNMSQHIATRWPNARNMLRPTMLRYVALACCDRLAGALGSLSTRVFEMRTATGSELFLLLTCPHTTTFTLLSIFSLLEMSSIKIWVTIKSFHAKCSLLVAVRV